MSVTRQAHRVALGAYSDALSSVLGAYSSGEVIRLDLTDFSSEAIITILRFLYTTELHLDCNTVGQVRSSHYSFKPAIILHLLCPRPL